MGNPDVSGVGPNWYTGGAWPSISGAVSDDQTDYNAALATLNTASNTYLAAKNALISSYATNDKTTITNARTVFNTALANLNGALSDVQSAYNALSFSYNSARQDIDNKFDANMSNFASNLQTALSQQLTFSETVTTTLGTQFATADAARIALRTAVTSALTTFYSVQNNLNNSLVNLQLQQDALMSAQAKYAADLAPPPASAAVLAADVADINNQTAVVNTLSAQVTTNTASRDAALSSVKSAVASYQTAIDNQIAILNQAALETHINVDSFLEDLQDARNAVLLSEQAVIDAAKDADQNLHNQHITQFPGLDAGTATAVDATQAEYVNALSDLSRSTLAEIPQFNTQVNVPLLPPAGKMSMSQLMKFITVAQLLLDQLILEIRRTDSRVNQLRLSILETAGRNDSDKTTLLTIWYDRLLGADVLYNENVAETNKKAISDAVQQINYYKANPDVLNQYIDDLNNDIDTQNSNGVAIVTALNSAIQMAADEYKVQLWTDSGQLIDYANKLQNTATVLASSDPLKAPLQTVANAASVVVSRLNTITGYLTARPIDETTITSLQNQLVSDRAALAAAIGALPSSPAATTSAINGILASIDLVVSDQGELQTHLHNSEVNAASAYNEQITSERTRLDGYHQDITRLLNTLAFDDPNVPLVTDYLNSLATVTSRLDDISTLLTTFPIDLAAIDSTRTAAIAALSDLQTAKNALNLSELSSAIRTDIDGVDFAVENIYDTLSALDDYATDTTTTMTFPPDPPGTVKTALMPPPILLEHVDRVDPDSLVVPEALDEPFNPNPLPPDPLPTTPIRKLRRPSNEPLPKPPDPADVAALNNTISQLNQLIAPVVGRIQADGGTETVLIQPIFVREYVPIRDPSTFIDPAVLDSYATLLASILQTEYGKEGTSDSAPRAAFLAFRDFIGNPNVTTGGTKSTGVGAGVGVAGANLDSSAGNISQSLSNLLSSTDFSNYVRNLFENAGIVAGLAAVSKQGQPPPAGIAAKEGILTAEQKVALAAGVQDLLATTQDVPKIKSELLALLKASGTQNLSDDEIQQLLSLLLFLIQLLALLVAAVAVAAGTGTTLDQVVGRSAKTPSEKALERVVSDLRILGVKNLPGAEVAVSSPQFTPKFVEAITVALTPAERIGFVAKVETVFTDRGITLSKEKPIAQAIDEALGKATSDIATKIRQELTRLTQEESERIRLEILNDEKRRPSLTDRIKQINPEGFKNIPQQQLQTVEKLLDKAGPKIPGLSTEDRNNLVIAVLGGIISPEQAKKLIDQFLKEDAFRTNPVIGNLLAQALETEKLKEIPQAIPGNAGELPDTVALIREGFKAISKQTTDETFADKLVASFSSSVKEQSDFYQKSLSLILDPANTYVKNFSIVTRQPGRDNLGSVSQIPISG